MKPHLLLVEPDTQLGESICLAVERHAWTATCVSRLGQARLLVPSITNLHGLATTCDVDAVEAAELMYLVRASKPAVGLVTLCAEELDESLYPSCCVHLQSPYSDLDLIKAIVKARWKVLAP